MSSMYEFVPCSTHSHRMSICFKVYIIVSPFCISLYTVILLLWLLLNCSEQQKEKTVWLHIFASLLQVNKTVQLIQ